MSGNLWYRLAAPQTFYPFAARVIPWCSALALLLGITGLYMAFFVAPTDAQQGEAYRIIFIHVPAAWLSMFIYAVMAFWSAVGLIWRTRLSSLLAQALAPTGAMFTVIALWTGAFWGKPTWGTYWVWDARLTSELLLLFLYVGFMALTRAFPDSPRGDRAGQLIALVGAANLPVIYFSVQWWNTLHQGASVSLTKAPSMASIMLLTMLVLALAGWAYSIAVAMMRVRRLIVWRERHARWVQELLHQKGAGV